MEEAVLAVFLICAFLMPEEDRPFSGIFLFLHSVSPFSGIFFFLEVSMKNQNTKKLTVLAMLAALSYVVLCFLRFPVVLFLKYEPKDVIITIGGFLYGPLAAFAVSVVVSFLEMLTISDTGWIGMVMNILSTCSFACTASYFYKKRHTLSGAVTGLLTGIVLMVALMLGWNYLLTPLYMGQSRADVAAMLVPVFLPFNLIKGGLNGAITALLYRPLVRGLRRTGLFPESNRATPPSSGSRVLFYALALLMLGLSVGAIFLLS